MLIVPILFVLMVVISGYYFSDKFRDLYLEDKRFFFRVCIPCVSGGVLLIVGVLLLLLTHQV